MMVRRTNSPIRWTTSLWTADGRRVGAMAFILTCPKHPPKGNRFCGFEVESLRGTAESAPVVVSPEGAPVITVESTGRASSASRSGRTVEYTIRGG